MGLLIQKTDFTGYYKISQNNYTDVDAFISRYEARYLIDLLGVELYDLFAADVASYIPVTAKYLALFNVIREDDNGCIRISEGMKNMILGFVYFEFMRQDKFKATPTGMAVGVSEVNREASFVEDGIFERYNSSIRSYKAIQWYIQNNSDSYTYPEYNGQPKKLTSWF